MIRKVSGGCNGKSKKKVKSCDDANYSIKGTSDIYASDIVPGLSRDKVKKDALGIFNKLIDSYRENKTKEEINNISNDEFANEALAKYIEVLKKNGTEIPDYAKGDLQSIFKEASQSIVGSTNIYAYEGEDADMSDWSFQDMAQFVASNFDSITGQGVDTLYNPPGDEYEETLVFDQDMVDDTQPALEEFLNTHTDWDMRKIEDFWYFLDDYLTMNYDSYAPGVEVQESVECSTDGVGDSEQYAIVDWLYDHKQAAEDCENHFGDFPGELPIEDLLGWIYDHGQLWSDFTRRFPDEARWFVEGVIGNPWGDDIEGACGVKSSDLEPYHAENPDYIPEEDDLDYYGGSAETGEFKDIDVLSSESKTSEQEYIDVINQIYSKNVSRKQREKLKDEADYLFRQVTNSKPELRKMTRGQLYKYLKTGEFKDIDVLEAEDISGDIRYSVKLNRLKKFIMQKLEDEGYPPNADYAESAAELLLMGDEPATQATVDDWFDNTKMNYPEDLEDLGALGASESIKCSYPEDYMLNGSEQYAAQEAMEALDSGDEDDIETAVSYAVNLVNNANAESDYENEDFYMEEADYDTVLQYVKQKRGQGVESCDAVMAADYIDDDDYLSDLAQAVEDELVESGYTGICSVLPNGYLEVQLYPENEEEFEYGEALYTYLTEYDYIEPGDSIDIISAQIAADVIYEYDMTVDELDDIDDFDDDEDGSFMYEEIDSKTVPDSDGFTTDYTMYRDESDGTYFFVFGDKDLYPPDRDYADWECDTEEEAYEWFNSYNGFDDEED